MIRRAPITALLVFIPLPLVSAGLCQDTETIDVCWERLLEASEQSAHSECRDATEAEARERLADKGTGSITPAAQSASSLADFLPVLAGMLELGSIGGDPGSEDAWTLDANPPGNDGWKLQATRHKSMLFTPRRTAVLGSSDPSVLSSLEQDLGDFADVEIVLAWSPMNQKLGRKQRHHQELLDRLFGAVYDRAKAQAGIQAGQQARFLAEVKAFGDAQGIQKILDATFADLAKTVSAADMAQLEEKIQASAALEAKLLDAIAGISEKTRVFRIADLVNNQPQLVVTSSFWSRDDLAGPDAVSLKLTYEMGVANVNRLRKSCTEMAADDAAYLDCFSEYVQASRKRLDEGDRLAVSLEYTDSDDYRYVLPGELGVLEIPADRKLKLELVYGLYLGYGENPYQDRLDVSGVYEDFGDDPAREDRAIFSATYSRKIFRDKPWALVVGFSWANHDAFLEDVDRDITGHFGVKYRFVNPDAI